jgi:hypothetical protein
MKRPYLPLLLQLSFVLTWNPSPQPEEKTPPKLIFQKINRGSMT